MKTTIVDKINSSLATVQELSILAGVSADKMYKWCAGRAQPNGDDIIKLEKIFQQITNLSKEEIKILVAKSKQDAENNRLQGALRIATGNTSLRVEDLTDELTEEERKKINGSKLNVPTPVENRKGTPKFIPPHSKAEDEPDMYQTLNAEMVRHLMDINMRLVETNAVLARKVPDQHEAEMPAKKRRHG